MKKLIFLLLLPTISFSQVEIDDSAPDDTSAIQAAFDTGNDVAFKTGVTYVVSSTINIDASGQQEIVGQNAKISVTGDINGAVFVIHKPDESRTIISDLEVDGDFNARKGFDILSPVTFSNVDVRELFTSSVADGDNGTFAFNISIDAGNDSQNLIFDKCDVYDMVSDDAAQVPANGNSGTARAYNIDWDVIPNPGITITISNFIWNRFYGDDAGPINTTLVASGDFSSTTNRLIIRDGQSLNWQRRGAKIRHSNIDIINVLFRSMSTDDPNWITKPDIGAGLIGILGTPALNNDGDLENININGCTFEWPETTGQQDNRRVYITTNANATPIAHANGITIANCIFKNGTEIRLGNSDGTNIGDLTVCNTVFEGGGRIYENATGNGNLPGTEVLLDETNIGMTVALNEINYRIAPVDNCPDPISSTAPTPPGTGGGTTTPNALKNATSAMLIAH